MNRPVRSLPAPTLAAALASALALGACSAPPAANEAARAGFYSSPFERRPDAATLTELGRALFSDPALSASGRLSCASCHDPARAYGPPDGRAVQAGGADLRQPGLRAVPSLRYAQDTPPFSEHYQDSEGADSEDQGPTGGRGWDGRAASAHEQASLPLLSPFEMANAGRDAVLRGLRGSANAARFRAAFGEQVFEHPALAWNGLLMALETFQQSPPDFYPYSSKYDAVLRGRARLSPSEARGLALFDDEHKGGCARCHPSALRHGALPQFSDRGYAALGLPRNPEIAANADPLWRDQG
ncbi:MAG: cytochrome-c peroxidase, partial [Burkholderiales bacterium]|nr:cytochrome-c peroxidase [Burkholderiales bacterium]